jgi:uncharacterized MAPEG superfamily protein
MPALPASLQLLAYAAALTWVMIYTAATLRSRAWNPVGVKLAMGNREAMPEPSAVAARADRAAKNMIENLVLFVALIAAAHLGGRVTDRVTLGAHLFFWARVAYWPIYLAGVPYLRTLIWWVGVAGLALIFVSVI